jgi:hypothetical protein
MTRLKFRKAGFLRYGFKAGLSDSAFPVSSAVKPHTRRTLGETGLHLTFVRSAAHFGLQSEQEAISLCIRTATSTAASAVLLHGPSL